MVKKGTSGKSFRKDKLVPSSKAFSRCHCLFPAEK